MDRRSFLIALIGGGVAASLGGVALAEAAQPRLSPLPDGAPDAAEAPAAEALDKADAEFSQYYYRRRYRRRYGYGGYRRRRYGYGGYRRRRYIDRRARSRSQR